MPLVAYGDALAGGGCDGAAWTAAPGQRNPAHPLASTHALVAEALALWFGALGARVSVGRSDGRSDTLLEPLETETETGTPLWEQPPLSAGLAAHSVCEPRSMYDARHPPSLAPPAVTFGNWELIEDRPGKPGWISRGPNCAPPPPSSLPPSSPPPSSCSYTPFPPTTPHLLQRRPSSLRSTSAPTRG